MSGRGEGIMTREHTAVNRQALYLGHSLAPPASSTSTWSGPVERIAGLGAALPRQAVIGLILVIALLSFEIFNFDTTQYALANLLGEVSFLGLRWATILAIAFCAIDFAGLAYLLAPERSGQEAREAWYLMGAWLLGATMNALMTWWAISLTLLSHEFGNEVVSREQLLQIVPVFVAILVWLTRILFIAAFSVAGEHLFRPAYDLAVIQSARPVQMVPAVMRRKEPNAPRTVHEMPTLFDDTMPGPRANPGPPNDRRVRQRPPQSGYTRSGAVPVGVQARRR
jgi:hypothetical protein